MRIRHKVVCGAVLALLSVVVHAQTPGGDSSAQNAPGMSAKALARADGKAERAANKLLAKKVQQAIYKSPALRDTEIVTFATARTGKVILAGMIDDPAQEQTAVGVAQKIEGVQSVTSKLSLRAEGGH